MQHKIISFPTAAANCEDCRWSRLCVMRNLDATERAELARFVTSSGPIKQGEQIFRQGDPLTAFHVIRAGSVKTYFDSQDGCEQAVAYLFPGDLLGFDALAEQRHPTSAMALETTSYCTIPYERVESLASKLPRFWHEVMSAAARQADADHHHAMLLGQKSAPARLASFLLDLSQRFAIRGCSKTEFNLSMSRQEIANYLAVAVETISRLFTELHRTKVIAVDRRFVKILSLPALEALANEGAQHGIRIAS
jgi:CRP/FNR family transcriptional regulator, anaerobic regulatory protein